MIPSYSLLPLRYQLSARKIFRALPARELSRPYDSVPQIAKAQEITANRLIYGNYRFGPSADVIDLELKHLNLILIISNQL